MNKYATTESLSIFSKAFEKKIKNFISTKLEDAIEIPSNAIEDIGNEINNAVKDSKEKDRRLEIIKNDQNELENNLAEISSNVYNLRLFTFFSFLMNIIMLIFLIAGGLF